MEKGKNELQTIKKDCSSFAEIRRQRSPAVYLSQSFSEEKSPNRRGTFLVTTLLRFQNILFSWFKLEELSFTIKVSWIGQVWEHFSVKTKNNRICYQDSERIERENAGRLKNLDFYWILFYWYMWSIAGWNQQQKVKTCWPCKNDGSRSMQFTIPPRRIS